MQYYEKYPKNKPEVQEFTSAFLDKNGRCGLSQKIRRTRIIGNIKNYMNLNGYKIKKVSVEQGYRLASEKITTLNLIYYKKYDYKLYKP